MRTWQVNSLGILGGEVAKQKTNELLEGKIATFLRKGGEIESIPSGVSGLRDGFNQIVISPPSDISMIKHPKEKPSQA